MPTKFENLTIDDILTDIKAAPKKAPPAVMRCATCGKAFTPKRLWQKFCSERCRGTYHKEYTNDKFSALYREIERLRLERDELIRECAELRRRMSNPDLDG